MSENLFLAMKSYEIAPRPRGGVDRCRDGERIPLWCHGPVEELTGRGAAFDVELESAFRCGATAPLRSSNATNIIVVFNMHVQ